MMMFCYTEEAPVKSRPSWQIKVADIQALALHSKRPTRPSSLCLSKHGRAEAVSPLPTEQPPWQGMTCTHRLYPNQTLKACGLSAQLPQALPGSLAKTAHGTTGSNAVKDTFKNHRPRNQPMTRMSRALLPGAQFCYRPRELSARQP